MKAKVGEIIYHDPSDEFGITVTIIAENQYQIIQSQPFGNKQAIIYINRQQLETILKEEKVGEWKRGE